MYLASGKVGSFSCLRILQQIPEINDKNQVKEQNKITKNWIEQKITQTWREEHPHNCAPTDFSKLPNLCERVNFAQLEEWVTSLSADKICLDSKCSFK